MSQEHYNEPPPLNGEVLRFNDGDTTIAVTTSGDVREWGVPVWRGRDQQWQWLTCSICRGEEARRRLAAALAERDRELAASQGLNAGLLQQIRQLQNGLSDVNRELAKAVNLVRAVEWGSEPVVALSECPWCLSYKRDGHKPDCKIARTLAACDARTASAQGGAKGGSE